MSQCIRCGQTGGEEHAYACVVIETETVQRAGEKRRTRITRETITEFRHVAVCPSCAGRAKVKAVLMTIPITLAMTAVMTVLSLFTARPNRNIRREVSSMPTVLPIVAAVVWVCGLSVYLPRPKELYAAEIARKFLGLPNNSYLLPLERRCFTRRERGELKMIDITHRTPLKTELAEIIIPVIEGRADEAYARALVGRTFTKEESVR